MTALLEKPLTKADAEQLWEDLSDALTLFEDALQRIIAQRAWVPLGYATFAEAWKARMSGHRFRSDLTRAVVVYALLAEGKTDEEIVRLTSGSISDQTAARLREQKNLGVPPHLATTRVRSYYRSTPTAPRFVHVEFTQTEYENLKGIAEAKGLDLAVEAKKAIQEHFRRLECS